MDTTEKRAIHLFMKYRIGSIDYPDLDVNTIDAHLESLRQNGAAWWGTGRSFSTEMVEQFRRQIGRRVRTKAYLYEIESFNWYSADVEDISVGMPPDPALIPAYYREDEYPSYIRFSAVKKLPLVMRARRMQNPVVYVFEDGGEGPEYVRVISSGLGVLAEPHEEELADSELPQIDEPEVTEEAWISLSVEKDLENYVAAHPEVLEEGLTLVKQQYETGIGRIDVLFRDPENSLVVVETKKGRESDKVIGQILRYIGWLRIQEDEDVRGIVVTGESDVRLDYAAAAVPNLSVVTYRVRFDFALAPRPEAD